MGNCFCVSNTKLFLSIFISGSFINPLISNGIEFWAFLINSQNITLFLVGKSLIVSSFQGAGKILERVRCLKGGSSRRGEELLMGAELSTCLCSRVLLTNFMKPYALLHTAHQRSEKIMQRIVVKFEIAGK